MNGDSDKQPVVFKSTTPSNSKFNLKILAGVFVFLFLVGGVGAGVYLTQKPQNLTSSASEEKVDLAFQPSTKIATPSAQFQADVTINTKTAKAVAAEVYVKFDPEYLRLDSITTKKDFLDQELRAPRLASDSGSFIIGTLNPDGKTGTGILATLNFTALKNTSSPINVTFDAAKTKINVIEHSDNAKGALDPLAVTIGQGVGNNASPSPSPHIDISYDFNNDTKVNAVDLSILYSAWGTPTTDIQKKADTHPAGSPDGSVNGLDYSAFLPHFAP